MLKNREKHNEYQKSYRLANLEKDKAAKKRYYEKTKDKFREREKIWRKNNPQRTYISLLKCRYGLSLETYNKMKLNQNNKCKLCKKETKLFVDHCHNSGKIRGLLCNSCNKALGLFYDSVDTLKEAVIYLEMI